MRTYLVFIFCISFFLGKAQLTAPTFGGQTAQAPKDKVKQHARWKVDIVPAVVEVGKEAEIVIQAEIDEEWYLYSSDFDANLGPIVTSITFKESSGVVPVGKLVAIHPKKKFDDIWGGDITYFIGKAEFRQKIKVTKENPLVLATIEYQTCTIKDGACVSGEYDVEAKVKTVADKGGGNKAVVPSPKASPSQISTLKKRAEKIEKKSTYYESRIKSINDSIGYLPNAPR
jgi:thiol:disulfide interchange protein DsbD